MLEVGQATIITADSADENDDGDFLDITAFAAGASFSLAAWGAAAPCHACEHDDKEEQLHKPKSWHRSSFESDRDNWSVSSSEEASVTSGRRVRFSTSEPQVRHYTKPTSDDWSLLYYSCHELQKIVDEYRMEEQEEQEWQEECAAVEKESANKSRAKEETTSTDKKECAVQLVEVYAGKKTAQATFVGVRITEEQILCRGGN